MDLEHVYKDFSIIPIMLYHDVPNCGYKLFMNGRKLIYITDTKKLDGIEANNFDIYLLEGNYVEEELEERIKAKKQLGEYVYEYRVKETHLSVEQATEWLLKNMGDNSIYEFMHIHKDK